MNVYLSKYFYVKQTIMDYDKSTIIRLVGYFTNESHTMYLPPQDVTRDEAITMMDIGIILFTESKAGQQKLLKKVELSGVISLQVEG